MSLGDAVLLRRYEPRDLDEIVALDVACFDPPFRFSKASMRRFAQAEDAWALIAESHGQIAGFCIVHLEKIEGSTVGYVITIDVAAAFRRHGLGDRMLSEGEAWVRASGGVAMLLHVYVKNEGAVEFYKRSGYQRDGEQHHLYGPGIHGVLYWKRLL